MVILRHLFRIMIPLLYFLILSFSRSISQQNQLLQRQESRRIVRRIEDDKSSLLWLRDNDSCGTVHSIVSESSDLLEVNFDFDPEVFNSRAYQTAVRAGMRQALAQKKGKMVQRKNPLSDDIVRDIDTICSVRSEDDARTVKAEPVDFSRPSDGILIEITTELRQTVSEISEDNVASYSIAYPTSPPQDNTHKEQGNEPASSLKKEKPLPDLPSSISQASAEMFKNEFQRQHKHLTDPTMAEYVSTSSRQFLSKRRDSPSFSGFKEGNLLKSFKSRFPLPSDLHQQPRISQVTSAGVNESDHAAYKVLEESRKCPKVPILGTSGAGKSTLLKSMNMFAGGTFSDFDREVCKETICSNILGDIYKILYAMKVMQIPLDSRDKETYTYFRTRWVEDTELTPRIACAIEALWSDSGVQECFRRSNGYHWNLDDSSG